MKRSPLAPLVLTMCAGLFFSASVASAQEGKEPAKPAATAKEPAKEAPKAEKAKGLSVGDAAPELKVARFVKGEPVTGFEKGKIYVVECWATWCGPCREAFPHLSSIAKKHKDKVSVVGISVWEDDAAKVEPFVKEMGEVMSYNVAMDSVPAYPAEIKAGTRQAQKWAYENGAISKAWLQASGSDGIPAAFIVNGEGKIAWIGDPRGMEETLEKIVAGKYDVKAAAVEQANAKKAAEAVQKFFQLARKGDFTAAYAHANTAIDGPLKDSAEGLNEIAWTIVNSPAMKTRDLDVAMKAATRANELTKGKNGMILDTVARVYWEKGDKAKAVEFQKQAVANAGNNEELVDDLKKTLEKYEAGLKNEKK